MTNYNERLDEALERLAVAGRGWGVSESGQIESMSSELDEAKQAILRWVADEVIKVPIDYSMSPDGYSVDMGVAERRMSTEQLKILAQHGYKGDDDE